MEKEIICFEEHAYPIKLYHLNMHQGATYRGVHSHGALEIVRVNAGQLHCWINNEEICLHPGEVIFINSNVGHRLSSENAAISYIHLDVRFFMESTDDKAFSKLYAFIARTKTKPYLVVRDNEAIQEILEKINSKYHENQISSRLYIKAYIYELIAFLYSQSFMMEPVISAKQIEKIKPIVCYVDANFRSFITLEELCEAVGYNRYSVCHSFKSVTGATVFAYINFLRVDFAVGELRNKDSSILEVATESGFSSPTYFNRVFKSVIGCSPSVYKGFFSPKA